MKQLIIKPEQWHCTLEECPPGFFVSGDSLCFKTEYRTGRGEIEAYNSDGEFYHGPKDNILPVVAVWEEIEL